MKNIIPPAPENMLNPFWNAMSFVLKDEFKTLVTSYQFSLKVSVSEWFEIPLAELCEMEYEEWAKIRKLYNHYIDAMHAHFDEIIEFHGLDYEEWNKRPIIELWDFYLLWTKNTRFSEL